MKPDPIERLVPISHGDEVETRMPTAEEAVQLGYDEHEPVMEVRRTNGDTEVLPARGTVVIGKRMPAAAAEEKEPGQ